MEPVGKMFQGDRVILKGRVEIGLGGVAGVARLREKRKIRQLQVRDDPGNGDRSTGRSACRCSRAWVNIRPMSSTPIPARVRARLDFLRKIEPGPFYSGRVL